MRGLFAFLSLLLVFCMPVYGAEACAFSEARKATFADGTVQLAGSGVITEDGNQRHYSIAAQMRNLEETRLRLNLDNEVLQLILTEGKIYDDDMVEQKVSSLFAKLVALGLLDTFFIIEMLSGERTEMYRPYISKDIIQTPEGPVDILQLRLSSKASADLYEHWTSDFRGLLGAAADGMSDRELSLAKGVVQQILTALEANVQYTFHLHPDTGAITQINIHSQIAAPEARHIKATMVVSAI